jgi:hypothetical protein
MYFLFYNKKSIDMISLPGDNLIKKHREEQNDRLIKSYSNVEDSIEKSNSIDMDDFKKKYPTESFDYYSEKVVNDFKGEIIKSEDFDEEIFKSEMEGLQSVSVRINDDIHANFYVKLKKEVTE